MIRSLFARRRRPAPAPAVMPVAPTSTSANTPVGSTSTLSPECLEYALANGEKHGIWACLSERERRRLRKQRRQAVAS